MRVIGRVEVFGQASNRQHALLVPGQARWRDALHYFLPSNLGIALRRRHLDVCNHLHAQSPRHFYAFCYLAFYAVGNLFGSIRLAL